MGKTANCRAFIHWTALSHVPIDITCSQRDLKLQHDKIATSLQDTCIDGLWMLIVVVLMPRTIAGSRLKKLPAHREPSFLHFSKATAKSNCRRHAVRIV
jgi:hypothetical protein